MLKLYDTAFKIGVCFIIVVFVILNVISFINRYEPVRLEISGPSWGYPFYFFRGQLTKCGMPDNMFFCETWHFSWSGVIVNIVFALIFSFLAGLVFRYIWAKTRQLIVHRDKRDRQR